jgi:AcrR family transcriptional regulator
MRYPKSHKEETRKRLVDSASSIAKRGGFDATGVDALMQSIGMSGGAFYNHFPNKEALLQAVIEAQIQNSTEMLAGGPDSPPDHVARSLRRYLSNAHVQHPESGCVLPALGAEIARASEPVRQAVENGLTRTHQSWAERIDDSDAAWALLAQCVGALVLARAVQSPKVRKDILSSSRRFIDKAHALDTRLEPATGDRQAAAA